MVKFINICFIILFLFSCKKDKVPETLGAEYEFLMGEWQWTYSRVNLKMVDNYLNYYNYDDFVYKDQTEDWCTLAFSADRTLTIFKQEGIITKKLTPQNVIIVGNNKIVRFSTELGEVITVIWSGALNTIEIEFPLFSVSTLVQMPENYCEPELKTITSIYEKQ